MNKQDMIDLFYSLCGDKIRNKPFASASHEQDLLEITDTRDYSRKVRITKNPLKIIYYTEYGFMECGITEEEFEKMKIVFNTFGK